MNLYYYIYNNRTQNPICVSLFSYRLRFTPLFSWKRRPGGTLVKTYHVSFTRNMIRLRYFRVVDPVLLANPCDCFRWQKLPPRRHAQFHQFIFITAQPSLKRPVIHTGSIGQFVFVCAFHRSYILLQSYEKILTFPNFFQQIIDNNRQR